MASTSEKLEEMFRVIFFRKGATLPNIELMIENDKANLAANKLIRLQRKAERLGIERAKLYEKWSQYPIYSAGWVEYKRQFRELDYKRKLVQNRISAMS